MPSAHATTCVEIFEGLLDFAGETVTIDGTDYDGQVSEMTTDDIIAAGGIEDGGGYRVKLRLSDFPINPDQYLEIIADGHRCNIIHPIVRRKGHLEIVCQRVTLGPTGDLVVGDPDADITLGDPDADTVIGDSP